MEIILDYLQKWDYTNISYQSIYHLPQGKLEITDIYAERYEWSFRIMAPHCGTGGRYSLRANPTATLTDWESAAYDTLLGSPEDVLRDLDFGNYMDNADIEADDGEFFDLEFNF